MSGRNLIIALFFIQASACISIAQPAPENLNEVFQFLDNDWSIVRKTHFKNLSESNATASEHFGMGLWIRNTWIRGDRNPPLVKYFHSIGLYRPDDISSVIMLSYHRKLNQRPLGVENQIKEHQAYWKKIGDCETQSKNSALAVYNKFKAGDNVTVLMYVDTTGGSNNAVIFSCPTTGWKFDPVKDLKFTATITDKYFINSKSNVFFKLRINKMNLTNTPILGNGIKVGEEVNLSLRNLCVQ